MRDYQPNRILLASWPKQLFVLAILLLVLAVKHVLKLKVFVEKQRPKHAVHENYGERERKNSDVHLRFLVRLYFRIKILDFSYELQIGLQMHLSYYAVGALLLARIAFQRRFCVRYVVDYLFLFRNALANNLGESHRLLVLTNAILCNHRDTCFLPKLR